MLCRFITNLVSCLFQKKMKGHQHVCSILIWKVIDNNPRPAMTLTGRCSEA